MRLHIYSVFDTASGTFQRPIFAISDGQMIRSFVDISVAADHPVGQHPEDYALYKIGEFDDENGVIKPVDRVVLITGIEAVARARSLSDDTPELEVVN